MLFIYVHVYATGQPIVYVTDYHCRSSSICLPTDSSVPQATAATLKERRILPKCTNVKALVLILCVSAMCPGVRVNQHAICTVTLTLVNHEVNRRPSVGL